MGRPPFAELNLLQANICQALADPRRILILYALNERPRHVSALAEDLDIPQSTVSRHLRTLHQQSLVTKERDGAAVIYRLADERIVQVLETMRQVMSDALERQSDLIEASGPLS